MTTIKNKRLFISIVSVILAAATVFSLSLLPSNAAANIGKKKAKTIAVKNAKLKKKNVIFTKCKLEYDDGVKQYNVEFFSKRYKFEYEIKASNGKILDKDKESFTNYKGKDIGKKKAKSIAVKNAGFTKSSVTFKKCKLDIEKRLRVYEVEFIKSNKYYEYDINAKNGKIVDKDVDIMFK